MLNKKELLLLKRYIDHSTADKDISLQEFNEIQSIRQKLLDLVIVKTAWNKGSCIVMEDNCI